MKTSLILIFCATCALSQIPTLQTAPTSADVARQTLAAVIDSGNASLQAIADNAARSLAVVWTPTGYTTTEALQALGTNASAIFAQHAAAIQYLWTDAARRNAFLAACARHNVTVSVGDNGAPVFGDMRPYTAHADGTITLD